MNIKNTVFLLIFMTQQMNCENEIEQSLVEFLTICKNHVLMH